MPILGIVSLVGTAINLAAGEHVSRLAESTSVQTRVVRTECAFVAQWQAGRSLSVTFSPRTLSDDRLLFAADARLDNRAELGAMLSISAPELEQTSDSELILNSYRRFGDLGVAHCLGAFAFAAWDPGEHRLILGRDCMGERAMFFHHGDGFVAFASELDRLLALPCVPREIDVRMMANFLALNLTDLRRTLYRGVERVPSRMLVMIDRRRVTHRHYWSPDLVAPPPYKHDEDYVERARELLDQAVATATADTPRVAISTSGGLDSSAIAATAARLGRAQSIRCFCIVPPEGMHLDIGPNTYFDERDKVAALARMYPALTTEFCVEGDLHPFEEDPTRYFALTSYPVRNPGNQGPFSMLSARVAATGHPVKLVGGMGNYGLSWAGQFSVLALLRQGKFSRLLRDAAAVAQQERRSLFRTVAGEIVWSGTPPALRRQLHRLRGRHPESIASFSMLNPALIAELDLARQWRQEGFDPSSGSDGWHPARVRARLLFDDNQVARDGRAMSRAVDGVEMRDPLADRRLLEFLLAVPEPMYRRNGVRRAFARAVLADRLPPEILNERRRGAQGVTWFRRLNSRRDEIAAQVEGLESSPLASRLLDVPRLKQVLQDWPKDENAAQPRHLELRGAFGRAIYVGAFIRWVESGNGPSRADR
jgi:asparagine synthase (glutamine-hydrolysing)